MCHMHVGYARTEITPSESVPLAGYGNTSSRMSLNVLDPLYATCIAFSASDGTKALIFSVDLINPGPTTTSEIRPAISQAVNIPVSHIHVSATHTHAGPDTENDAEESISRYLEYYKTQMVRAAVQALADLKPAQLYLARSVTQNMNFVRQYRMADGTYAGPSFGNFNQPIAGHECDADPVIQLAKITRINGKDILLCNFGVHQTDTGGQKKYDISADIAGAIRSEIESDEGSLFAYFTAAAGDVAPSSKIDNENKIAPLDYVSRAHALADYIRDAAVAYIPASFGSIRAKSVTRQFDVNHSLDHKIEDAREIVKFYYDSNDMIQANKLAREHGFHSVFHA